MCVFVTRSPCVCQVVSRLHEDESRGEAQQNRVTCRQLVHTVSAKAAALVVVVQCVLGLGLVHRSVATFFTVYSNCLGNLQAS